MSGHICGLFLSPIKKLSCTEGYYGIVEKVGL